jgi:hypothetical protein
MWNENNGEGISRLPKADDSLKSFIFTLKNPRNIPAKRFALMEENKDLALCCDFMGGPCFGGGRSSDIYVSDNCHVTLKSYTSLGRAYTNDTRLYRDIVFTGSRNFKVREIEVFEIIV